MKFVVRAEFWAIDLVLVAMRSTNSLRVVIKTY